MKYEHGEYIPLSWDGPPDAYYVMGHVEHEEGLETLRNEGVVYADTVIGHANRVYGRYSMQPGPDGNCHVLREYNSPGRGRFKITTYGLGIFADSTVANG